MRINHEAFSHEIANHDVSRCCRSELDRTEVNASASEGTHEVSEDKYPWTAPRVFARYLAHRMNSNEPKMWSLDDYDGLEPWQEEKKAPPSEFQNDIETSVNQYHKLINHLYQYEGEIDDLLTNWNADERQVGEWKRIQHGVQCACMEIYQEINNGEDKDKIDEEKKEAQFKYAKQQTSIIEEMTGTDDKQLHMFEKGRKTVTRAQPVEEASSDDESAEQLVCNMTGANWESLPLPNHSRLGCMRLRHANHVVRPRATQRNTTVEGRRILPCGKWTKDP